MPGRSNTYLPNQTLPNQIICYCADIEARRDAGGAKKGHNLPNQTFPKYMLQRRRRGVAGSEWCRAVPGWAGRYEDPPTQPTRPGTGRRARTAQPGKEHIPRPRVHSSRHLAFVRFFPVLRIRDVYPGSRILIFTHPGSLIPDLGQPGSRIQKQQQKRWLKQNLLSNLFVATKFTKLEIISFLKC